MVSNDLVPVSFCVGLAIYDTGVSHECVRTNHCHTIACQPKQRERLRW
jgi:hypothetical protein